MCIRDSYESRGAYDAQREMQEREDAANRRRSQDPYEPNRFMENRVPGFGEQSTRLAGMEASQIGPEAMEFARQGAMGERPSVAEEMLRGVYGRGMASARAQAATGRGNAYLAQRGATTAVGDMTGRLASEAGALRADEMAKYSDMYLKYSGINAEQQNYVKTKAAEQMLSLIHI